MFKNGHLKIRPVQQMSRATERRTPRGAMHRGHRSHCYYPNALRTNDPVRDAGKKRTLSIFTQFATVSLYPIILTRCRGRRHAHPTRRPSATAGDHLAIGQHRGGHLAVGHHGHDARALLLLLMMVVLAVIDHRVRLVSDLEVLHCLMPWLRGRSTAPRWPQGLFFD